MMLGIRKGAWRNKVEVTVNSVPTNEHDAEVEHAKTESKRIAALLEMYNETRNLSLRSQIIHEMGSLPELPPKIEWLTRVEDEETS